MSHKPQGSLWLLGQTGLSERDLVEIDGLAQPVVHPGVHDPDPVGDQLDLVDPALKVGVVPQRVDLRLRALDENEAAKLGALRFEDGRVETLDPPAWRAS